MYIRTARSGNDIDDSDRARNVDVEVGLEAAVEALRALLVPLNKLDVKWHTDVPALVGAWQHEHEQGMQDRKRRQDERIVAATESEQTEGPEKGNHANAGDMEIELGQREAEADAFQTAFASQQAQSTLSRDETAALHGAFTLWLQQQREKDARSNPHEAHNGSLAAGKGSPHGESASTGHKGSGNSDGSIKLGQRDWLMSLEVTECVHAYSAEPVLPRAANARGNPRSSRCVPLLEQDRATDRARAAHPLCAAHTSSAWPQIFAFFRKLVLLYPWRGQRCAP